MGLKRGFYMTKKRRKEFKFAYKEIEQIKQYIYELEFEKEVALKYKRWDEVAHKEAYIRRLKLDLLEYHKEGYIID